VDGDWEERGKGRLSAVTGVDPVQFHYHEDRWELLWLLRSYSAHQHVAYHLSSHTAMSREQ